MGNPSLQSHLKLKSRGISSTHDRFAILHTEYGSDTAVLCAKFQNDWITQLDVIDKGEFASLGLRWLSGGGGGGGGG